MILFVFISDAWGAVNGGINCFNYDLAIACVRAKKTDKNIKICCVVPDLKGDDQKAMKNEGIIPITLSKAAFGSPEAAQIISDNIKTHNKLRHYYPDNCNTFCLGHDIYTGSVSKQLAEKCNGWNIVFHHMDYASYYLLGKPNVAHYTDKTGQQEAVLREADLICAVGPMLLQSAQDIARDVPNINAIEVFPGLAEIDALPTPPNRFNPIVFGRVEKGNQSIKQIPLAIDSFAKAIAMDKITPVIKNNPTLFVIGYEIDSPDVLKAEVERLQQNAFQIAGLVCNIVPYPYTTDRKALGRRLRSASVVMMLSLHEGFGLVGYEAIAAGIPLILSKNTGLYMFLKREGLDHLVYSVEIEGSVDSEAYSQNDLDIVARALRDIRQNEGDYKKKALDLRTTLRLKNDRYSWEAVANNFISNVLGQFENELKKEATVFYRPEEIIKISTDLKEGTYENMVVDLALGKHVFIVEGKNTLASLVASLQKTFSEKYATFIYNVQSGDGIKSAYSDFLDSCRSFFGRKNDYKGPEFKYMIGERLTSTILILNNLSTESISDFEDLFSLLNRQSHDFYIFVIFKTDSPPIITPYHKRSKSTYQKATTEQKPISVNLAAEQKLLVKVLAFRDKMGYSKKLINYICNGINYRCEGLPVFQNIAETERELKELGLIEEYSEFSYQNVEAYLSVATTLNVDNKNYALGLYQLGRFYARCYYLFRGRDPQLSWGYFSCKCFSCAAALDDEIKAEIKTEYERILTTMRKKAMDTSDYGQYFNVLQDFIDEYVQPDNLWIWYILIHCESICHPSVAALEKVHRVLETEFPDADKENRKGNNLYIQLIRLCAELEDELSINDSLDRLLSRIRTLVEDNPSGTSWNQCFSTIVSLAMNQNNYDLAAVYLDKYRKITKPNEIYPKMVAIAMETNLKISKYMAGEVVDLSTSLTDIKEAFQIARNTLRDYRAQGWILGLWGECQIILEDKKGERNLRKSMTYRRSSGEKTKTYRKWLQRISKYPLQLDTKRLLNNEMVRLGI